MISRALADLRKEGYTAQVVEHRVPVVNILRDLFGGIDIVAIRAGDKVRGIQVTSGGNHAARVTKLREEPRLRTWIETGHTSLQVWSYARRGARGKRKAWELRVSELIIINGGIETL